MYYVTLAIFGCEIWLKIVCSNWCCSDTWSCLHVACSMLLLHIVDIVFIIVFVVFKYFWQTFNLVVVRVEEADRWFAPPSVDRQCRLAACMAWWRILSVCHADRELYKATVCFERGKMLFTFIQNKSVEPLVSVGGVFRNLLMLS